MWEMHWVSKCRKPSGNHISLKNNLFLAKTLVYVLSFILGYPPEISQLCLFFIVYHLCMHLRLLPSIESLVIVNSRPPLFEKVAQGQEIFLIFFIVVVLVF